MHDPALLQQGESRNPDRTQPFLSERQPIRRMPDDLKGEATAVTRIREFAARWSTQGQAAQHKRASVKRKILFPGLTLSPDDLNQFKLLEPAFTDAEARQDFAYRSERRTWRTRAIIEQNGGGTHKEL